MGLGHLDAGTGRVKEHREGGRRADLEGRKPDEREQQQRLADTECFFSWAKEGDCGEWSGEGRGGLEGWRRGRSVGASPTPGED